MRILRWTKPALNDIENLTSYIAQDNMEAAEEMAARILEQANRLLDFPKMGRPGRIPETRELVIVGSPYFVSYRITDRQIEIISVIHGARQWPD